MFQSEMRSKAWKYLHVLKALYSKTQISEGGTKYHLHLFGFYVLSKPYIAIKMKVSSIRDNEDIVIITG